MTKEEKKDELKNKISMALKDPILQQGFEIICKNLTEQEEKIADIKANFDYILEGKEIEYREERKKLCDNFENMKATLESQIATLGKRCNQLLKDKGDLTDELSKCKETLAQTIENDEVAYETLKLHDEEEIGMLNSKVAELEQQIEKMKCCANCKSFKGYGETCEGWGEPVLNLNCDCTEWELRR